MKKFRYKGKNREGAAVSGFLEGETRTQVASKLRQQGYYVTYLREVKESPTLAYLKTRGGRLKPKHLALFCRQFSVELAAGLSLVNSLQLLGEQAPDKRLQVALEQIRLDVASGSSLTKAIEKHASLFPTVFLALVEAGEIAGALPEVLDRLAMYYEREDELRKKVSEALMYPGIITSVAIVMVLILLFFVLPMLVDNFSQFGVEPPALTQAILGFRLWIIEYWYLAGGIVLAFVGAIKGFGKTPNGRYHYDNLGLMIPVVGSLRKMVIFSRFSRTLGLLLQSGISMVQSLQILNRLVDNVVVSKALSEAKLGIERGQGLSAPLEQHKVFPSMLVQMIDVGEETGNLETILAQIAEYYDREVNFAVGSFTKLLEPVVMLILAVIVLLILISVYLPMMEMVTQI